MKFCKRCEATLPSEMFARDKKSKDGLYGICKPCKNAADKARMEANPELREAARLRAAKWYEENRELALEWNRARDKEQRRLANRMYYARNKERILPAMLARNDAWRAKNPGLVGKYRAARRAGMRNATPPWVNRAELNAIYLEARRLERDDGIKRHVDHIVPIQGDGVCGLHVPWNLQILTATENVAKKNKFIPELAVARSNSRPNQTIGSA